MRIACVGYRNWALNIYDTLSNSFDHNFLIFRSKKQFCDKVLNDFCPDLVLFYGWSWMVSDELLKNYKCLMLHPSPLPQYRGGSPIQNQIINGEVKSKVTIFIMNSKLDGGDIVAQSDLSLEGSLTNIFKEIEEKGIELTKDILLNGMSPIPQDDTQATYYNRRKPKDSELTIEELSSKSAQYLFNKIRMLEDPYPNAFIRTVDGQKLLIKSAEILETK